MTNPRSSVVAAQHVTDASSHLLMSVPAGYTVIIKSVYVFVTGSGGGQVAIWVNRPSAGVNVYLFDQVVPFATPQSAQTWFVLEPGDALYWNTAAPPADIWVSGSILLGTPPF